MSDKVYNRNTVQP